MKYVSNNGDGVVNSEILDPDEKSNVILDCTVFRELYAPTLRILMFKYFLCNLPSLCVQLTT